MTPKVLFITGTGTDVGKTVVTAALAHGLVRQGLSPTYWKPIQTGPDTDARAVLRLSPNIKVHPSTFEYPEPLSVDQAAECANLPAPDFASLRASWPAAPGYLLIEGAGGLLVPLNQANETWVDFVAEFGLPVLVVAGSGLGTLNHTGLTLAMLAKHRISPVAVILSGPSHEGNLKSLMRIHPGTRIAGFPWLDRLGQGQAWDEAADKLAAFLAPLWPSSNGESMSDPYMTIHADKKHIWHPYTQHGLASEPLNIVRARGVYLYDEQGRRYLDATASWWVNTVGHGRLEIGDAIGSQQSRLDHVLFAEICHRPAAELAAQLTALSEGHLARVFFSDNGSTAVEIALKMAIQTWRNRGESRRKFLSLRGAYHGDTFGAMAVGGMPGFHGMFSDFLFETDYVTPVTVHSSSHGRSEQELNLALDELERYFAKNAQDLAGVIVEPWVQGAAGMVVQSCPWLTRLCELSNGHGIPLIFDEVFTGMGRLGHYFAFLRAGLKPDIVCIAKGLTGGTMPLSATLATEAIFAAFLDQDRGKALLHGHSFTGNPIACAAANATLAIYRREKLCERALWIENVFQNWISGRQDLSSARTLGAMLAFEWPNTSSSDYFHTMTHAIAQLGLKHGLLIRPLGNTVYLVPPLSITQDELADGLARLATMLELSDAGPNVAQFGFVGIKGIVEVLYDP